MGRKSLPLKYLLFVAGCLVVAATRYNKTATAQAPDGDYHNTHHKALRRKLDELNLPVDDIAIQRYKAVPSGYRKHPSYYSERYLPRARPTMTDAEKQALAKQWGSWTFVDSKADARPGNDFYDQFTHRDFPFDKLPPNAWQKDQEYLKQFLPEAIALTERAMEAVLEEYGRGKTHMPGKSFEERLAKFQLAGRGKPGGGGSMDESSYQGFKRRLLHAIMTEDSFNFAMGGHSAAAGHGNHFQQSYTLQIQKILEPVFARLGVKMTARNFGMGGLGTSQNSIAAGDIYGKDVDVLMWDSKMTEKDQPRRGVFALQGLIGCDRAPLQWSAGADALKDLKNTANIDMASYGFGTYGTTPTAETIEELQKLPWEVQYKACPKGLGGYAACVGYNGTCWIDRSDFKWRDIDLSVKGAAGSGSPGGRASWHPGHHDHQLIGRTFAMSTLQALNDLLNEWNKAPNYKLDDKDWHVTEYYKAIKDKLFENRVKWTSWCSNIQISWKFCVWPAQGRTEFTPRNRPWATSLRSIISGSETKNANKGLSNFYDPPDVYNPWINPMEGHVDAAAIIENGVQFRKNLARVRDSAENMQGPSFDEEGKGSKFNKAITGGKGWEVGVPGTDNCDGQYDSFCKRSYGKCPLSGHNDGRQGITFDGLSGWLIFNVPNVSHGLIMSQMWHWITGPASATNGWCNENNNPPCEKRRLAEHTDTTMISYQDDDISALSWLSRNTTLRSQNQRALAKKPSPPFCEQFKFEYAIDGKITSWNTGEWYSHRKKSDRVVEFVTLLDESEWNETRDVEVAMRITGCGRKKSMLLTHLYWI